MLGNSHTRQTGLAMVCQYSHVIRSLQQQHRNISIVEFENNSKLYLLTNTVIVYSYKWKTLLEVVVGKKLRDFDMLVLGLFNMWHGEVRTSFDTSMILKSKEWPDVNYTKIPPPTQWEILQQFPGRAVLVSMFSDWSSKWTELQQVARAHAPRVGAIDGRKYVPLLGECGSIDRMGVSLCYNNNVEREGRMIYASGMHRCVGAHGGHPDLVAYDVIEYMHKAN